MLLDPLEGTRNLSAEDKLKRAVRDAAIVAAVSFFSALMAFGYPPTWQALYMAALETMLMFFLSIMYTMKIKYPKPAE